MAAAKREKMERATISQQNRGAPPLAISAANSDNVHTRQMVMEGEIQEVVEVVPASQCTVAGSTAKNRRKRMVRATINWQQ